MHHHMQRFRLRQFPPSSFALKVHSFQELESLRRRASILRSVAMSGLTNEEAERACTDPEPATKEFIFQQTMFRIKDPKVSLDFYTRIIGMRLLKKLDFPEMKFTLYFMGYEKSCDIPEDDVERTRWTFQRKATLELTHNWGTENDTDAKYHNGNTEPRGFGHIGIMVPDVDAACDRFEDLGVKFVKKPQDGKMKGIAFIQDPDGYWIEILNCDTMAKGI